MKRQILIFMTIVSLCTLVFVSCNQEDDLWENVDLSINSQIPMTRSGSEQSFNWDRNEVHLKRTDNCGLLTLIELKIKQNRYVFSEDNGITADDYYENKLEPAAKKYYESKGLKYDEGAITNDALLAVGKECNLIKKEEHFVNNQYDYFSNKKNNPRIIHIKIPDPDRNNELRDHYAMVESVNRQKCDSITVTYSLGYNKGRKTIKIDEIMDVFY